MILELKKGFKMKYILSIIFLLFTLTAGCVVIPSSLQHQQYKGNSYYNGKHHVNVYTIDGYLIYGRENNE